MMSESLLTIVLFVGLASLIGALLFGIRDLFRPSPSEDRVKPLRLTRRPRASDPAQSLGPIGRFDRWFTELIRGSALSWDVLSTTLLLVLCGLLCGGILYLWCENLVVGILGVVVGMALPLPYLIHRCRKRTRLLQDQLPPALDMLARSVRAGESLDQALGVVGQHSPEPLGSEFKTCAQQLEMGLGMAPVMRSLVDRVRLHDVRILTTSLTVHRQTGGNVALVLERLARVIRDRISYRRQLRVITAAGRLSATLVALIGPMVFLFFFFFRTDYISAMMNSPTGQTMLVLSLFLEIVGLVWMARLMKPAY